MAVVTLLTTARREPLFFDVGPAGTAHYRLGKDRPHRRGWPGGPLRVGEGRRRPNGIRGRLTRQAAALDAVDAATRLEADGIAASVAVVGALNPAPVTSGRFFRALAVSVEAHYVNGALGSLAAEVIAEAGLDCRLVRCGVEQTPTAVAEVRPTSTPCTESGPSRSATVSSLRCPDRRRNRRLCAGLTGSVELKHPGCVAEPVDRLSQARLESTLRPPPELSLQAAGVCDPYRRVPRSVAHRAPTAQLRPPLRGGRSRQRPIGSSARPCRGCRSHRPRQTPLQDTHRPRRRRRHSLGRRSARRDRGSLQQDPGDQMESDASALPTARTRNKAEESYVDPAVDRDVAAVEVAAAFTTA